MHARREQLYDRREDTELALFTLARKAFDTNDVTTFQHVVQCTECIFVTVEISHGAHHLHFSTVAVKIIEEQLALYTLAHDTPRNAHHSAFDTAAIFYAR